MIQRSESPNGELCVRPLPAPTTVSLLSIGPSQRLARTNTRVLRCPIIEHERAVLVLRRFAAKEAITLAAWEYKIAYVDFREGFPRKEWSLSDNRESTAPASPPATCPLWDRTDGNSLRCTP